MIKTICKKRIFERVCFLLPLLFLISSDLYSSIIKPEPKANDSVFKAEPIQAKTIGDLDLAMPIFKLESGKIKYPLEMSYHAPIKMEDRGSWVGLGWSFGPESIVRTMVESPGNVLTPRYSLISGAKSFQFNITGTTQGLVNNWKVSFTKTSSSINYFTVTKDDGLIFIFGSKLGKNDKPIWNGLHSTLVQNDKKIPQSDTPYCEKRPCTQFKVLKYELTEIHGKGYSDANENGIADLGDSGDWVRFEYKDYTDEADCYSAQKEGCSYYFPPDQNWEDAVEIEGKRLWTTPPSALEQDKSWVLTARDQGFEQYASMRYEVDFVLPKYIYTNTHTLELKVGDRLDFHSPDMRNSHAKRLESAELRNNESGLVEKRAIFKYDEDYPLCQKDPYSPSGKLTLDSITLCNGSDCGQPIEFEYANNSAPGTPENPFYNLFAVDSCGYSNGAENNINFLDGNSKPSDNARAWALTKVKNLSGTDHEYVYSPALYSYRGLTGECSFLNSQLE
jgi:hypothetical protein